jgi:endo-1,4-beta-xylanase
MPSILLGAAVDSNHLLHDSQYRATLQSNFSLVVPENELKFEATEPEQGAFDFSRGDALINFAHEHGMWVRGHTLVWGEHLPTWLTAGQFTRDQVIDILRIHIQTVVRHYRGNLISWDVVNEPFDGNYLRDTFWMHTIGPDYIAMAFKWAHEADPDAKLFLNDFGDDEIGPKFDAIYHLVTTLRSQGVPINGVGMEMHIGFGAPADPHAVSMNMSRLKAAGLEVAVTEIDVQTSKLPGTMDDKLREQATIYGAMATACRQAGNCHAFVSWGVTDRLTWLTHIVGPHEAPLLFDENYQPKPAFFAVKDALYGSGTPARLTPTP